MTDMIWDEYGYPLPTKAEIKFADGASGRKDKDRLDSLEKYRFSIRPILLSKESAPPGWCIEVDDVEIDCATIREAIDAACLKKIS